MQAPRIDGLRVTDLTGAGPCGNVYAAHDESDVKLAVKVFHGMAINRALLQKTTARLEAAGWPSGVMQVVSADLESRPALIVMPWMADPAEDGHGVPRTLQNRLADFPGERSWPMVLDLARALAVFHNVQVAHGNLKPSNVFFDDEEKLSIADWSLGNMPGVTHADYSDAYLYQSPEQLRDPDGYLDEKGYRWDVFAFGVLAYRLITGAFPRCNETFLQVAPPPGDIRRDSAIHADLHKIARKLEADANVTWPDEAANPVEAGYREWIVRCLALDAAQRPATLAEVVRGFERVEEQVATETHRDQLLDQRRRADHRAWRALFAMGTAAALALVLGGLWQISLALLRKEKAAHTEDVRELKAKTDSAVTARDQAVKGESEAKQTLEHERDVALARLEASRAIGDHLFEWAMEKGHRSLPPLDGRELRLLRLERYFDDFLKRTADVTSLDDERARVKLELAEVSLAAGDANAAQTRLGDALEAWKNRPTDAAWKLRIGTDRLLLALLRQAKDDPGTAAAFVEARQILGSVPQGEVDADRLQQLMAVLDFHEAQLLAQGGKGDAKALEQLMRATQTLNRLVDQRPDVAVLRSELASCYLSSATILDGMGSLGDAREVRNLAAAELIKLLKEKPGDPKLRLELAGCYGAMAEAAVLSGDVASADSLSKQATGLLEALLREQPDNTEALSRLGAQRWIRAGLLRDSGKTDEAMNMVDDGIRMLEGARASDAANGTVAYRLALLWWQKGRMVGAAGKTDDELFLITKARDALNGLMERTEYGLIRGDQLKKSVAYLLGDLGHAQQLAGKNDEAKKTFAQAVIAWETLVKAQPRSEEAEEALSWCRQRLKEMP
ncbi:protein kinase [Luteolibacter ambystomatis]|uniref:protein kinase domain-containing protein n=1 Tax=Luteolibacter ambystomatis TaxID=2824561 RepID=UPI001CF78AB9|nr:protein kinase [Luteolibacter ambystomatis]